MNTEKRAIRNIKGTLVCEIRFADGRWYVEILDHKCYTLLELPPNGAAKLTNYEPGVRP